MGGSLGDAIPPGGGGRGCISVPARSLGGRNVGMRRHYAERMQAWLPDGCACAARLDYPSETFYVVGREA